MPIADSCSLHHSSLMATSGSMVPFPSETWSDLTWLRFFFTLFLTLSRFFFIRFDIDWILFFLLFLFELIRSDDAFRVMAII